MSIASPRLSATHWLIVGVLLAELLLPSTAALAVTGPNVTLPNAGVINKSGLRITIDGRGIDANGYRPIRVTVSTVPLAPLTADRQIRVVLKPYQNYGVGTPAVSQVIELPEGSSKVEATIAVPQSGRWQMMSLETWEGGEKWRELSADYLGWVNNSGYWDWTEARPAMLVVDSDALPRSDRESAVLALRNQGLDPTPTYDLPDVRTLARLFPEPNAATTSTIVGPGGTTTMPRVSDVSVLSQISDFQRIDVVSTAELPPRWIELSQLDLVLVSLDDLVLVARQQPQAIAALRDWLSTGPLLVVYGVGDDFQRLAELERLLELPRLTDTQDQPAEFRGWSSPSEHDKNNGEVRTVWDIDFGTGPRMALREARDRAEKAKRDEAGSNAAQALAKPPFLKRSAHFGCVVAIASDEPFPGTNADWAWIFNSVSDNHWRWFQRNGFSLHRKNDDYWRFLIPGVGEAPVVSFLLLVSLFAVVIGPLNYIFLSRSRRLYLLLITVPAGAAIVTGSLFAYALTTDGLGVRLRTRSFSVLDQQTGRAASWSRQSYYASIAPSGGLVFPEDSTVVPILYQPNYARGQSSTHRLDWELLPQGGEGQQRLRAGYLPSRTASQFMVQRATQTDAKLVVREQNGQKPAVENRLGTTIRYLLLCDGRGDYYAAASIEPGEKPGLERVNPANAERELRKLYEAVQPALPRNYDPNLHNNMITSLMPNYGWMSVDSAEALPAMAVSLLETNLAAASLPTKQPLAPGTYIAVVASSPVVPIGVPRVREEASLHVIRGRW